MCPKGFDTCLVFNFYIIFYFQNFNFAIEKKTNLVETSSGDLYGVRSCAPAHLCTPGVYHRNDTGTKITTKCCTTDLCISYNYILFQYSSSNHLELYYVKFFCLFYILVFKIQFNY